ncbi:MAG TPA: putative zinc-binding protein [Bacteroidales bacterium]|nr:putative zinc-binding protein [Bacteroidales bacterium]HOX76600.1 putative zinc-binding protein [Bacteroidales bacterium]HPM92513.1 putative zinc-binding protein [Bacteroidales bacterium]
MNKKVKVIPCSGIGKVYGLIARESALKTVFDLLPEKSETVCLAYIVTGDKEAREKIEGFACITVDGCPKMCASKNVSIAGGNVMEEIKVLDTVKEHKGKKFGSPTQLDEDGELVTDEIAAKIAKTINELNEGGK